MVESFVLSWKMGETRRNMGAIFSPFGYERWDSTNVV